MVWIAAADRYVLVFHKNGDTSGQIAKNLELLFPKELKGVTAAAVRSRWTRLLVKSIWTEAAWEFTAKGFLDGRPYKEIFHDLLINFPELNTVPAKEIFNRIHADFPVLEARVDRTIVWLMANGTTTRDLAPLLYEQFPGLPWKVSIPTRIVKGHLRPVPRSALPPGREGGQWTHASFLMMQSDLSRQDRADEMSQLWGKIFTIDDVIRASHTSCRPQYDPQGKR